MSELVEDAVVGGLAILFVIIVGMMAAGHLIRCYRSEVVNKALPLIYHPIVNIEMLCDGCREYESE